MKLISTYSKSHERLVQDWFLPTLPDELELSLHYCDVQGAGRYMDDDWTRGVIFKCDRIIDAIRENRGQIIVYSDVDIQFFGPVKEDILETMKNREVACQLDSPAGLLCTGFFAVRANDATLALWQEIRRQLDKEKRDQKAFNRILQQATDIRFGHLPTRFFGPGTFFRKSWRSGDRFYIPLEPLMFHANWVVGVENKLRLHHRARAIVGTGRRGIIANNLIFLARAALRHPRGLSRAIGTRSNPPRNLKHPETRPTRVCLDAATICQLKCPACPTANGAIARSMGGGLLTLADLSRFLHDNPWVSDIEVSNWGEVFLNPELVEILECAHNHAVAISMGNGVNLNTASAEMLEALVKYGVRRVTCSIDGASPETYSIYRRRGKFNQVIANIGKINEFKKKYNSEFPALRWQFVVFGHNEHEIGRARRLAGKLNMSFAVKLSWDDLYTEEFAPVRDRAAVRSAAGVDAADRQEYERKYGRDYAAGTCEQIWKRPRINHDGRLLGCSINHWGDFGNVFEQGLETCLAGEKIRYAKAMLRGEQPERPDIPCTRCKIFASMKRNNAWVGAVD